MGEALDDQKRDFAFGSLANRQRVGDAYDGVLEAFL
jgi:hypothetical protein